MNAVRNTLRLGLAWIALAAAQMIAGMLIHVDAHTIPNMMGWLAVANTVIVLALGAAALRSDWRDWRLARAMFFIPAAIAIVDMIEGVFFLTNSPIDWRGVTLLTLASYAMAAVLWLLIFRGAPVVEAPAETALPHRSLMQTAGRLALCSAWK